MMDDMTLTMKQDSGVTAKRAAVEACQITVAMPGKTILEDENFVKVSRK